MKMNMNFTLKNININIKREPVIISKNNLIDTGKYQNLHLGMISRIQNITKCTSCGEK